MRIEKRLLKPESVRRIPEQFSWVDHRLIRERRLADCSHAGWALYLFLVTVGDAQGLSYYSDRSVCAHLGMQGLEALCAARVELVRARVIAYAAPIYQVLGLDARRDAVSVYRRTNAREAVAVGDVIGAILARGGAA
ncbi:MAG: hypothetical protein PHU52_05610 [Dehalococcoidales bacterium]|nr:hypothetical protein [Dehalococcoidales bacterium]